MGSVRLTARSGPSHNSQDRKPFQPERGMPIGPDGDEELLLEELEPEPESVEAGVGASPSMIPASAASPPAAPPLPRLPALATSSPPDAPAFEEAAAEDARADASRLEDEAGAEPDFGRRAALWLEVARIEEAALGDGEAALRAARAAFAAEPSFVAALGPLRRLLVARGLWEELASAYEGALTRASLASEDRADLLVERGRVLEDRLGRAGEARQLYGDALDAAPDHVPALLAL